MPPLPTCSEELIAAKTKEVEALTAAVESKTKMIGELGVDIVQMKEDLDDTQKGLLANKKFLKELETSCATKTKEWDERSKTRAEELVALADTIKAAGVGRIASPWSLFCPSAKLCRAIFPTPPRSSVGPLQLTAAGIAAMMNSA